MLTRRLVASLVVLLGAGFATAQTGPQLLTVFPPGAKAGETVEVTFSGSGFDGDEKLLFSADGFKSERVGTATVDPKAPKGIAAPATAVKFKVTAPKAAGTCDVRVVSKSGLSNPRAFVVGELIEANETEGNNDVGQAQKIALDTTVNGVISAPTDVDYAVFKAKAGQGVVVSCLTTSIDSRMTADIMVATVDGKPLTANRGYRGGDAVLDFKVPTDGDYLVRVAQFAYTSGGSDHFYRLTVSAGSWVDAAFPPLSPLPGKDGWKLSGRNLGATTVPNEPTPPGALVTGRVVPPAAGGIDARDPFRRGDGHLQLLARNPVAIENDDNSTPEKAQSLKVPADVAGRVDAKNDRDWYSFDAKKGDVWTVELFADRIGSEMDAYFALSDEKGKVIVEADDGPDPLNPNQFYTKSDDPARYRFSVPADGKYRVMVSSRDAGSQFGVRQQYVLRVAKENPDFRLAVMPLNPVSPDAGTLPRSGAVLFNVYVFRFDGFTDAIELTADKLPPGVKCPPQTIGAGQTRGTFVLIADKDAKDWEGFVTITGTAGKLKHEARPFTIVWTPAGMQANQPPPNTPMLTRMDRSAGLSLAVRGDAPFTLTPTETDVKAKAGDKIELTLKVTRDEKFKDGIAVFSGTPNFGIQPKGGQPAAPIATIAADKSEMKVSVDVAPNTPPGTYTLVLTGRSAVPPPKGGGNNPPRPQPTYPAVPVTVVIGKK